MLPNNPIKLNSDIALNNLKKAKGFLIYDIESDPDIKHDFLHGFIRIPNNLSNEINLKKIKYSPLLNLEKNRESSLWERINRKLNHHIREFSHRRSYDTTGI